jgi:hypothetical protein
MPFLRTGGLDGGIERFALDVRFLFFSFSVQTK